MAQLKRPGQPAPDQMMMGGGGTMASQPRMTAKPGGPQPPMPPGPGQPGPFTPLPSASPTNIASPQMENYGTGLGDGMGMVKDVRLKQPAMPGAPVPGVGAMGRGQGNAYGATGQAPAMGGGPMGGGMPNDVMQRLMSILGKGRGGF